jgi:glycosyltransferase involved in cell wall biosynthesis
VANFGHPPNVDGTIWFVNRVFPRVRAEVPNVTVRLVGRGPTDDIVALAENPGVELVGYVEDLGPEMEACALTLAAVREGGGLRTKVLESFAYGRTAVVTPIGAAGIVAEDGVEFRIGVDERETADAIVELLHDDEKRHAMEESARELVLLNYTNELMADRSEVIFGELMT